MAMGNIGSTELIIILIIVLLLFGARRIPEIARSMGSGDSRVQEGHQGYLERSQRLDAVPGRRSRPARESAQVGHRAVRPAMPDPVVIDALGDYPSPDVARFVWQLEDQTRRMLRDLADITPAELEWQVAPGINTIGMLLAHIAIAEVYWTQAVLEETTFDSYGALGIGPDDDGMPLPGGAPPPPGSPARSLATSPISCGGPGSG